MRISSVVKEGLGIALGSRALWLFGFFVGVGSSGSGSGSGSGAGGQGEPAPGAAGGLDTAAVLPIVFLVLAVVVAAILMRLLSEGALIEGVRRSLHGEVSSVRDGFREGWAHIGTVLSIKLTYFAASAVSIGLLALPGLIAARIGIFTAALALGIPALLVAVPWLVTLYLWQAFALRIAVLENRRARDAIGKARLFLHGRLLHGLKLMIATLLGSLLVVLAGVLVLAPFGLLIAVTSEAIGPLAVLLGLAVVVPAGIVVIAVLGTYQSSIWTIGYLNQVEA